VSKIKLLPLPNGYRCARHHYFHTEFNCRTKYCRLRAITDCYTATNGVHTKVQISMFTKGFSTAQRAVLLDNIARSRLCIQLDTLYIHKQLASAPTASTQLTLLNAKVQAVTSEEVLIMTVQNIKVSGVSFMCISKTYLHDFMKPTKSSSVRCPKTHWHHITSYVFGSGEKS